MWRRWPLPCFNAEGGSGGGDSAPPPAPAAGDPPAPAPAPAGPSRPDWLPETAWDAAAGKPTVDVADLLTLKQQHDEHAGQVPKDAAEYQVALPEAFQAPEGFTFDVDPADPLLAEARIWAKENGLSQAQFSGLMALRAKMDIAAQTAAEAAASAELAKLGDTAKDRIDTATTFLRSTLPADQFAALKDFVQTAKAVEAVETLMTKVSGQVLPGGGNPAQQPRSIEELFYPTHKRA